MSFSINFPAIARLLGEKNSAELDLPHSQLGAVSHIQKLYHLKNCEQKPWCGYHLHGPLAGYPDILSEIDWALTEIERVLGSAVVQAAYTRKAVNAVQFHEMVAEICTAATCAVSGKLVELEARTGVGDQDADVRGEFSDSVVDFEVTLRTEMWRDAECSEHQIICDGKPVAVHMTKSKARPMVTTSEIEIMEADGHDFGEPLPEDPRAPHPEPDSRRQIIAKKAAKFDQSGVNIVVLAENEGFREYEDTRSAVYGSLIGNIGTGTMHCAPGGLFTNGRLPQLYGVLRLDTVYYLDELRKSHIAGGEMPMLGNALFVNPASVHKLSIPVAEQLARAFGAKLYSPE